MDAGVSKLLESVTQRTLHAHNFSRSSSQATHVLTDLLTRYLSLLSSTCAQYAQHAGRSGLTIKDALLAMSEMGLSMDELNEYCEVEGKDMGRYGHSTARRAEELAELKASLVEGQRVDRDDAVSLVYARVPSPTPYNSDGEDDDADASGHSDMDVYDEGAMARTDVSAMLRPPSTPPLPLSPISNPSSPARKRPRTSSWRPPDHVPDFLPPYPSDSSPSSPQLPRMEELAVPHVVKLERPLTPPPQLSASASTSDYLTPVPYSLSSLSTTPQWHLPKPPSPPPSPHSQSRRHSMPLTHPSLVKAYHHVLTHPPPPHPPTNPSRHKIAMSLLAQNYTNPRWTPADTMFSNSSPAQPRVVAPSPSFPVPLQDTSLVPADPKTEKGKEKKPPILPPPMPRPVATNENVTPLSVQPYSRIPEIARHILPPAVYNRTTKLLPPPPLISSSNERFLYGQGIPAPWNANLPAATSVPGTKPKDTPNGKSERPSKEEETLADARLFATWDWEARDFRVPLAPGRRARMGSLNVGAGGTPRAAVSVGNALTLGRVKSEREVRPVRGG